MNLRNIFRMAESNPFTDEPLGLHWHQGQLYDDEYKVGYVTVFPIEQVGGANWQAHPFWNEEPHWFATQEEAASWLVAMYKMGGIDGANLHNKRRPRVNNRRITL